MTHWYFVAAALLLLTLLVGLIRVALGPTEQDRMLGAQLFGTTGVSIVLLLGYAMDPGSIIDVALVMAVLAAVAVVTFVQRVHKPFEPGE